MAMNWLDISGRYYVQSNLHINETTQRPEYDTEEVFDIFCRVGDEFKWRVITAISCRVWDNYNIVAKGWKIMDIMWPQLPMGEVSYKISNADSYDSNQWKPRGLKYSEEWKQIFHYWTMEGRKTLEGETLFEQINN